MLTDTARVHMRQEATFAAADVTDLLDALRVPGGNVSQSLALLKKQRLVLQGRNGGWALTAHGEKRASEVMGQINAAQLEPQIAALPGTLMGSVIHTTLPPTFAPLRWQHGIARLTEAFPFDTNVFVMTRFPEKENKADPLHRVLEVVRDALTSHGLAVHLASDRAIDEDLLGNIAAHMWACRYGIGIFEDRAGRGLNYNVLFEVGAMTMAGRPCALLKDTTAPVYADRSCGPHLQAGRPLERRYDRGGGPRVGGRRSGARTLPRLPVTVHTLAHLRAWTTATGMRFEVRRLRAGFAGELAGWSHLPVALASKDTPDRPAPGGRLGGRL